MMPPISFFVPGVPKPAGSKRAFIIKGRAIITDANKNARDWKIDVQHAARSVMEQLEGNRLSGPLKLHVVFNLPRPKSHYRTGKNANLLRDDAPAWHTSKPDTTKLLRGLEDALTGMLWGDDSQVCVQTALKRYSERPGADVTISEPST